MENSEILDNTNFHETNSLEKKQMTLRLFRIGGGIFVFLTAIITFLKPSNLITDQSTWLALSMVVPLAINVAGLILAFIEKDKKTATLGKIGNLTFIICSTSMAIVLLNN